MKYLIEEAGAKLFVGYGSAIIEPMETDDHMVLDCLLQHAYQLYGDNTWWRQSSSPLKFAIETQAESCAALLLHWGTRRPKSLFETAIHYGCLKTLQLLVKMYPQFAQDSWKLKNEDYILWVDDRIVMKRKYASRLDMLCRAEIFQQLGYNPMPKAEQLPLPRSLIHFVQYRDIKDLHDVCGC